MTEDLLSFIENNKVVDLRRLLATLIRIESFAQLDKPAVEPLIDPKEGFLGLNINVRCRDEREWDELIEKIKGEMEREEFEDVKRKVAIICVEALQELLS